MDEAPLLVLTDYNATVFLRRSKDVKDNRLWASEPVWVDQHHPPAFAAWINALQQAKNLRCLKQALPRARVPHPLEERHTQPCQQQTETQRQQTASDSLMAIEQCAALNDSAAHSRKRKRADEQETEESRARIRAVRHLMSAFGMPQLAASSVTNSAAEETLLLSELGLTDELLAEDPYAFTFKVNLSLQLNIAPTSKAALLVMHVLTLLSSMHRHFLPYCGCSLATGLIW